ncbi:ubiquitin elongating factor core-domain-containing protein [Dipodascopsis uninucleata]
MSEEIDTEAIRRKRLAKLQGDRSTADRSSTSSRGSSPSQPGGTMSPSGSIPQGNPFGALAANGTTKGITGSTEKLSTNSKPSSNDNNTIKKTSTPTPPKHIDMKVWEESTLEKIFKFTLKETSEPGIAFLKDVASELQDSGSEARLSTETLDQAIVGHIVENHVNNPLEYLINVWNQTSSVRRSLRSTDLDNSKKMSIINQARRLCSSYAVLCVTMPDMFGLDKAVDFVGLLLIRQDSPNAIPVEFLDLMIVRATEDETITDFIGPVLEQLSFRLKSMTMVDNYLPYLQLLQSLVVHKPVVNVLTSLPSFIPENITAPLLESATILGPFLRLSPVDSKVANTYFANSRDRPQSDIDSAISGLRAELSNVQESLSIIVDKIVRASAESRERMLQYFAITMNLNHRRHAIQVEPGTVSSDGFMLNITAILNKLCEPFVDATFSKIDKIDPLYYRKTNRIDIREEVKLDVDQQTFEQYNAQRLEGVPNFISEVFYLNVACHHYGLCGAFNNRGRLTNDIKDMEKHMHQLEAEQPKWANSPQAVLLNTTLTRVRNQVNQAQAFQHALTSALHNQAFLTRSYAFLTTLATWLVRLVDPQHQHPQKMIKLPIDGDCPDTFKNLPEYFVENLTAFLIYMSRNIPQILFGSQHLEFVVFALTFLRMSSYIKNPYLKAKIVEVLFYGTVKQPMKRYGFIGDTLNSLPLSHEHLFHTLMQFYIEIEQTGASSQFYDKFNIRYYISQIIKCIWDNPIYRDKLEQESKTRVDFFVRFVALLLNDVTYLLDESLSKLAEIHKLQGELAGKGGELSQQERTEREASLATSERQATSYMSLANETVSILKLFTKAVPLAFVTPEIVDRLAAMLDYNLDALVGPKCTGLKVKDPQKYQFNPKALLSDITDVYLNLSNHDIFVQAIARDGRSYRREIFTRAGSILTKYAVKSSKDIDSLQAFADKVEQAKTQNEQGEEELGDIPDEFLDPLMYTLMEDPVILPSSRVSLDRATIKSHLLSDSTDPFNRMPLKLEDVIPNNELKQQIEDFKRSKRSVLSNANSMEIDG